MPRYDIEQWEHETAEVEIRRWLTELGLWAPDVEFDRLEQSRRGEPLGVLSQAEIDRVLHSELVGRVGCCANGKTYVVPITYAYDGHYIYGHSGEGMKIRMMRANPHVCFEVDHVDNLTRWESVIAWGRYEELRGEAARQALDRIVDRLKPMMVSTPIQLYPNSMPDQAERAIVTYRIALTERTGRYEQRS